MDRYFSINVFEQPWVWAAIGLWLSIGLLLAKRRWPLSLSRKHLLIGPLLVVLAFGLDWLMTTDREKIETVVAKIARATKEENAEEIISHIGPGYRGQLGHSRQVFAELCRQIFSSPQIQDNWLLKRELALADGEAMAHITALSQLDQQSEWAVFSPAKTVWQVELTKQPNGSWKIVWIELLELNNQRIDWDSSGIKPDRKPLR